MYIYIYVHTVGAPPKLHPCQARVQGLELRFWISFELRTARTPVTRKLHGNKQGSRVMELRLGEDFEGRPQDGKLHFSLQMFSSRQEPWHFSLQMHFAHVTSTLNGRTFFIGKFLPWV